jgi:hypothetical protein
MGNNLPECCEAKARPPEADRRPACLFWCGVSLFHHCCYQCRPRRVHTLTYIVATKSSCSSLVAGQDVCPRMSEDSPKMQARSHDERTERRREERHPREEYFRRLLLFRHTQAPARAPHTWPS